MRHPFWILNTSLLVLLLVCAGFIFFTQQTLPKKMSGSKKTLAVKAASAFATEAEPVAITKIYENDLFDTYHEKIMPPLEPSYVSQIPTAPSPSVVTVPEDPLVPFLPPLKITLKGIMILNDESHNVVVIEDNATKKEQNYKVGDAVEDAELVRILHNRVVLIRSNGQFETLYLSEKDIADPVLENDMRDGWIQTAKKIDPATIEVDPTSFVEVVQTLAEFIDMFDITTVYKRGKNIGCRIGKIAPESLPTVLGLEPGDIILSIAGIQTTSTDSRLQIFRHLAQLKLEDSFTVTGQRSGQLFAFSIVLKDLKDPLILPRKLLAQEEEKVGILTGPSPEELEQERIQILKDRYTFAQTAQDILIEQREQMLTKSKKDNVKKHPLPNES